ncbi:MAG: helix-turn-helix domain-containing protein [Limisphaerales bacterium]
MTRWLRSDEPQSCRNRESGFTLKLAAKALRRPAPRLAARLFLNLIGLRYHPRRSFMPRVKEAKKLLLNPNYGIEEIAAAVGFNSVTCFNRAFQRIVGESPAGYRSHMFPSLYHTPLSLQSSSRMHQQQSARWRHL